MLSVGDRREKFCELCERVTTQRLERQMEGGQVGQSIARLWWCIDGDHVWGARPTKLTPLQEPE